MVRKLLEIFIEKNFKKTSQKEFRIEQVLKIRGGKLYMTNRKYMIIHLIVGLIENSLCNNELILS